MTTSVDRHIFNMAKSLGAVECFDKATFDFVDDLCNCIENKKQHIKICCLRSRLTKFGE